ncbi:unnamed protein product [Camellia sinensis]
MLIMQMTNVHTEYLPEIVVACSAGNSGPTPSTVTNVAPWIITVAASSIDRVFPSPLVLGNQMKIQKLPPRYPFTKACKRKDCCLFGIQCPECYGGEKSRRCRYRPSKHLRE